MPRSKHRRYAVGSLVIFSMVANTGVAFAGLTDFTIPEAKLLGTELGVVAFGPAALIRQDAPGPAVDFAYTGLASGGTAVKDNFPVDTTYGQVLPSHGNGDFSGFVGYQLLMQNLDDLPVHVAVFVNTGFTGPSGNPPNNPANDTFWQSPWVTLQPNVVTAVRLDFDNATAFNINDNPPPHTPPGSNAINAYDRTELSSIGFQVAAFSPNPDATVRVIPLPEPATFLICASGALLLTRRQKRVGAPK